ncbi:MAG TPA: signal peptidase II, partial [Actinomycetota bacterium]
MSPKSLRLAAMYGTAAVVVVADQASKYAVVRTLAERGPLHVLGSFVEFRFQTNSGGAFSLFTGVPLFFALMAMVIIGGIVYAGTRARGTAVLLTLGLLLGGAIGNLLDRALRGGVPLRGEVVDFVKVGRWPVFNLADSCITVGGLLLALLLSRAERDQHDEGEGAQDEAARSTTS